MLRLILVMSTMMLAQAATQLSRTAITAAQPSQTTLPQMSLEGTIVDRFVRLLVTENVPGGVVTINDSCSRGEKRVDTILAGTTLDRAFDSIIKSDGRATWVAQDGVVDLLPTGSLPDLLRLPVHNFEWDKTAPADEVLGNLLQSLDITKKAKDLGLEPAIAEGGTSALCIRNCEELKRPEPLMASENDATVLSILNRIVAAHPHTVWSYSEFDCHGNHEFEFAIVAK